MTCLSEIKIKRLTQVFLGLFLLFGIGVISWTFPLRHTAIIKMDFTLPPQVAHNKVKSKEPLLIPTIKPLTKQEAARQFKIFNKFFIKPMFGIMSLISFFVFVLLLIYLVTFAPRGRLQQANSKNNAVEILHNLHATLANAKDKLLLNENYGETVRDCYVSMLRILVNKINTDFDTSITTREFLSMAREFGITSNSVELLTKLYESVRYQVRTVSEQDRQIALGCIEVLLTDINNISKLTGEKQL